MAKQTCRALVEGLDKHLVREIAILVKAKVQEDRCCCTAVNKASSQGL